MTEGAKQLYRHFLKPPRRISKIEDGKCGKNMIAIVFWIKLSKGIERYDGGKYYESGERRHATFLLSPKEIIRDDEAELVWL